MGEFRLKLSKENAAALLEDLHKLCFEHNFGSMSKRDYELLLFHYLHESMKSAVGSELHDTDFELGKILGLTNARVRNLKEQENLKYPPSDDNWWKDEFKRCLEKASFDESTRLIKFNVPDVNLMKEIRNYFDQMGVCNEYQLNPSLFQCKLDVLLDVCFSLSKEEFSAKDVEKKILEVFNLHRDGKIKAKYYAKEHPIKAAMKNLAGEAVKEILSDLPLGQMAGTAFCEVCKIVKRTVSGN